MNTKLILLAISLTALSSCTTLYKSGQTPDDVYFSPARSYEEARTEDRVERRNNNQYYSPQSNYYYNDDVVIRMGIYDPRWRYLDNNSYYNPYMYGFNTGYYYNPYYYPYPVYGPIYTKPTNPKITTPRISNLGGYGTVRGYNNQPAGSNGRVAPARRYNNNNGTAVGNALRKVLGSDNNNSNYRTENPNNRAYKVPENNNTRTYTPSTNTNSSSSGSSSSGSSGGGVSRPPRAGN